MTRDIWVHQVKGWGIGNFINCTPAIQVINAATKTPVPVYFDDKNVQSMFEGWETIEVLDKCPSYKPLISSDKINQSIPDWEYLFNFVTSKLNLPIFESPHTYVHAPDEDWFLKPSCVIIRGMVNDSWAERKDPGDDIYKHIIARIPDDIIPIFIGTSADFERTHDRMISWIGIKRPYVIVKDDMKQALNRIKHADFVISNDTGMYHAAAALNKKQFVMWKNTNFIKNQAPGDNNLFSQKDNWKEDFDKWIKQF